MAADCGKRIDRCRASAKMKATVLILELRPDVGLVKSE